MLRKEPQEQTINKLKQNAICKRFDAKQKWQRLDYYFAVST